MGTEPDADASISAEIEVAAANAKITPFQDLNAPSPAVASPPTRARLLGFGLTLAGGLLSALIGYGVGELLGGSQLWAAIGGLIGAVVGAVGVGILSNLTLQAMAEWKAVHHPEAGEANSS